jgi:hypothetical protein
MFQQFPDFFEFISPTVWTFSVFGKKLYETSPPTTTIPKRSRVLRQRSSSQIWSGAKRTINGLVLKRGDSISVRAPLCVRSSGRYDYPLPNDICRGMENKLRSNGILNLVQYMLKGRGIIRAQNVMLSAPGSINQPVHTDSQWSNRPTRNPKPHYLTVLIALTDQDLLTGGTKVYPGKNSSNHQQFSILIL